MKRTLLLGTALLFWLPLAAGLGCDDGNTVTTTTSVTAGVVTIGIDEGINFSTGQLQQPGNYGNSDLYTSQNGSALKLTAGGKNIVDVRAVTWFQTSGGVYPTYDNIGQVPNVKPDASMDLPLPKTKVGNGFTLLNAGGTYTKGFITAASDSSVTIQYEPML